MKKKRPAAALEVNLRTNRLGLRSKAAEILEGEPVLRRTVSRLLRVEDLESVWIVAPSAETDSIRALLKGLPVEFHPSDAPDIPSRGRLRRGRLWALGSWRGGLGNSYFSCEAGRPRALLELAKSKKYSHLLLVPAEAPLLSPAMISTLLAGFRSEGEEKKLYLSTAPPGLSGDLYSTEMLEILAAAGRSVDGVLDFRPDAPEHYVDGFGMFHWYPNTITSLRARLCADTERSLNRIRLIAARLGAEWESAEGEKIVELLREEPRLLAGDFPREIVLEITSRRAHEGPVDGPPGKGGDLDPEKIEKLLLESSGREDVLFSLGIMGDPLLHPRIVEILALFRRLRPFGLHIRTTALSLTDEILAALRELLPDVVSVPLDAVTSDTYARLHGTADLERAEENARRIVCSESTPVRAGPPPEVPSCTGCQRRSCCVPTGLRRRPESPSQGPCGPGPQTPPDAST